MERQRTSRELVYCAVIAILFRRMCYALWAHLERLAMEPLDIFTVRDLRQRSGELLREAEEGRLTIITKHGRPTILALPFDERLLAHGVNRALGLHLFEAGQVSLAQAAKIASLAMEDFIELLGQAGIPAVDYDPAELALEIETLPVRN